MCPSGQNYHADRAVDSHEHEQYKSHCNQRLWLQAPTALHQPSHPPCTKSLRFCNDFVMISTCPCAAHDDRCADQERGSAAARPRSASAWAHLRSLVRRNLPCTAASTVKGNLPFVVLVMKQPTTPGSDGGRRTRTADANARCTPAHAIARTPDAHAHAPHHHDHQWQKAAKLLRFGRIANARPQSVPWRSGWNSSKHRRVSEPTTPALRPCMTAIAYTRHSHT